MRKNNILSIFLLLVSIIIGVSSNAQVLKNKYKIKKEAKIVFDFNAKGIRDTIFQYKIKGKDTLIQKVASKLWFSKRTTFQVKINPYLYDVSVAARQVNDEGIVDSTEARLFLAALTTLSENKLLLDSTVKNTQQGTETPKPKSVDSVIIIVSEEIEASNNQTAAISSTLKSLSNSSFIAESINKDSLKNEVKALASFNSVESERFRSQMEAIEREKTEFDEYKRKRIVFKTSLDSFLTSVRNLENEYDICEYSTLLCLTDKLNNQQILDNIQQYIIEERRDSLANYINRLPGYLSGYRYKMDSCYKEVQHSFNELSEAAKPLKYFTLNYKYDSTLKQRTDSLYLSYNRVKPEVFVKGFTLIIRNLQNQESFSHICPPVLINKDTLIYTIEIKPSERFKYLIEKYGIKTYNTGKFDYPVPIKGNFKVNFSIGAAFMQKGLRSRQYFFNTPLENLDSDDATVFIKQKESSNDFLPAIAAYTHGYLKFGGWFTPAITVGLSTNPTDFSNASYFAGFSLICGQQNRLIFTIGIAGSSIDVLKGKYDVNAPYKKRDFLNIQESDLTRKGFQSGWFWGVSYNISSNR